MILLQGCRKVIQPSNAMLRKLLPRSLVYSGGLFTGNSYSNFLLRSDRGSSMKKTVERGLEEGKAEEGGSLAW